MLAAPEELDPEELELVLLDPEEPEPEALSPPDDPPPQLARLQVDSATSAATRSNTVTALSSEFRSFLTIFVSLREIRTVSIFI